MSKTSLIIKREYITRVRKKSFIIMSLIGPLLFGLMFVIPIYLSTMEGETKLIEVVDESGFFVDNLEDNGELSFIFSDQPIDSAKDKLEGSGYFGVLYIPEFDMDNPQGFTFYSEKSPGIDVLSRIGNSMERKIEDVKLKESGIDKQMLSEIETDVEIKTLTFTVQGEEKEANSLISTAIGYISSLLIYIFIFMYGVQVMRGVIEEKSNRIIEVIVSSVRPAQLMMGKITGIGLVSLTQFLVWAILSSGIYMVVLGVMGIDQKAMNPEMSTEVAEQVNQQQGEVAELFASISNVDFGSIFIFFVLFFIGAYFLYGSLFAAIGSAVDSDSEAQQFQLPVTVPLIFSIIMLGPVLKDPDGSLAFWLSVIPFTSPVVMMMRIPFNPPMWQVILSIVLLYVTNILSVYAAGRIYRIGILMHGTKVNYKVLAKWFTMKI